MCVVSHLVSTTAHCTDKEVEDWVACSELVVQSLLASPNACVTSVARCFRSIAQMCPEGHKRKMDVHSTLSKAMVPMMVCLGCMAQRPPNLDCLDSASHCWLEHNKARGLGDEGKWRSSAGLILEL